MQPVADWKDIWIRLYTGRREKKEWMNNLGFVTESNFIQSTIFWKPVASFAQWDVYFSITGDRNTALMWIWMEAIMYRFFIFKYLKAFVSACLKA